MKIHHDIAKLRNEFDELNAVGAERYIPVLNKTKY